MTARKAITTLRKLDNDETYGPAVAVAISALEKEIPKKPIEGSECGCCMVYCPNCKGTIYDSDWRKSTQEKYHNDICLHCRQRLTKPSKYLGTWED